MGIINVAFIKLAMLVQIIVFIFKKLMETINGAIEKQICLHNLNILEFD